MNLDEALKKLDFGNLPHNVFLFDIGKILEERLACDIEQVGPIKP